MVDEAKNRVLAFLPVMIELENAGFNPVKVMFSGNLQMDEIEETYKAINRAKKKFPKWYKAASQYVGQIMKKVKE